MRIVLTLVVLMIDMGLYIFFLFAIKEWIEATIKWVKSINNWFHSK